LFYKIPQWLFTEIKLQKFVTRGLCQKNKNRVMFTSFNAEKCNLSSKTCKKYKMLSLSKYSYIFWPPNIGNVRICGRSDKISDLYIWTFDQVVLLKIHQWDSFSIKQAEFLFKLATSLCHLWKNHIFLNFDKLPLNVLPIFT
jgi:hypothetical protein